MSAFLCCFGAAIELEYVWMRFDFVFNIQTTKYPHLVECLTAQSSRLYCMKEQFNLDYTMHTHTLSYTLARIHTETQQMKEKTLYKNDGRKSGRKLSRRRRRSSSRSNRYSKHTVFKH